MVGTYYIKFFCTEADRHNGIFSQVKRRKALIEEVKYAYQRGINDG